MKLEQNKILLTNLRVIEGRQGLTNAGPLEKEQTEKAYLYLKERHQLTSQDIARLAGYGKIAGMKYQLPRERLDLLFENVRTIFGVDMIGDVFMGQIERYKTNGALPPSEARRRHAASNGHTPTKAEPPPHERVNSGKLHLHEALDDFRAAKDGMPGIFGAALTAIITKIEDTIVALEGPPTTNGAHS